MGKTLKIYNEFGEMPKVSFTAAGQDFCIPKLNGKSKEQIEAAKKALCKSYNITLDDLEEMKDIMETHLRNIVDEDNEEFLAKSNALDALHLYLALDPNILHSPRAFTQDRIEWFCMARLAYSSDRDCVGIHMETGEQIKINSGIHEVLPSNHVGIMLNKSGKGNDGFDVRSQVIDEDYTGIVHLSLAYTKVGKPSPILWCGDKIVQQVIVPVWQVSDIEEISSESYNSCMEGSERGDQGFGSTDNM